MERRGIVSDYYTVTQFAELTGKDTGNIRRLLANGKIPGEKLGKQWIIPKTATYPEDARIKSGNYRNWRRKPVVRHADPDRIKALLKMSNKLRSIYKEYLVKIILYGEYAHGNQTKDSSIDIAVILNPGHTEAMHDALIDTVVDYQIHQGVTLSVVPIEHDQFERWKKSLPFYKTIDEEGIIMWKSDVPRRG